MQVEAPFSERRSSCHLPLGKAIAVALNLEFRMTFTVELHRCTVVPKLDF
jgi:hypothetical protein